MSSSDKKPRTKFWRGKSGCLYCVLGETQLNWSGAAVGGEWIARGGYTSLAYLTDNAYEDSQWPEEELIQCKTCGSFWDLVYWWTDRPPLMLKAEKISNEKWPEFLKGIKSKMAQQLADGVMSQSNYEKYMKSLKLTETE